MQQGYRTVLDALERLIEGAAQQGRERATALVVIGTEVLVNSFVVKRHVRIARPGVDGKASRIQPRAHDGMAKRRIGHTAMDAQLNHESRPRRPHDPLRERH